MADWEIRKKISRMALGWDNYELVKGKAKVFPTISIADKDYMDKLERFHKDTMKFLRSLDVYENDDRLDKVQELIDLIRQGESIGKLHTDN